jgi:DNA-binding transcriptional ArsR family regulator
MEDKKNYFAIIPANVRYDPDLTANAKLLYGEISALCNEKGYCWSTNKYFSDLYGVSQTSISKWISALAEKGYVFVKIIYREGTKEILHRYLSIVKDPIEEKLNTPIEENFKENITGVNSTVNNSPITPKGIAYSERFERFWKVYPSKVGKRVAWKAFQKLHVDDSLLDTMMKAIEVQKHSDKWKRGIIPNPSTWLNQGRWEDEQNTDSNVSGDNGDAKKGWGSYLC